MNNGLKPWCDRRHGQQFVALGVEFQKNVFRSFVVAAFRGRFSIGRYHCTNLAS